ncbi:MAG: SURF1 family protein [Acidimicrobiales bacterium]
MFLTPRWLASHLFAATLIVAFIGAGFWQVDRLGQRQETNERIEARLALPVEGVSSLAGLAADDVEFRPLLITGEFDDVRRILVANRSDEGSPGFWDWTVFAHDDGEVIVNRGFVPRAFVVDEGHAPVPPSRPVTLEGVARVGLDSGKLSVRGGEVSRPNAVLAAEQLELTATLPANVYVQLLAQDPMVEPGDPRPVPIPELSDGPHRSYAFQWFTFATIGLVGYAAVLLRIRRGDQSRGDVPHAV